MENANKKGKLLSIYGCRKTKNGNKLNITLVGNDEKGNKTFYNALVKLDNTGKVKAGVVTGTDGITRGRIYIPFLEEKKSDNNLDEDNPF